MMIWHIFKKDWKLLWPLVVIVAAAQIMNAALWFILGYFGEPRGLRTIASNFPIVLVLGVAALIVVTVHQDALPGDRQDWLVRPIRRRDLILAKLLFVLVAIHGPMLLVDLAHCMATGFTIWDSLSAALSRNVYLLLSISLPVLALAAMTATIVEVIGGALAIFLVLAVFLIAIGAGTLNYGEGAPFSAMSNGWLMLELWSAVALAAAVVVIPLLYFRRATKLARGIVLGSILLLPVSAFIPWSSAFAFQQWLSADPAAAKGMAVAFDPNLGKITLKPGTANLANSVWLPLRVSGLEPESIVLNERTDVRIIGRDGAILFRGLSTPQTPGNSGAVPLDIDDFPVRATVGTDVSTHQLITLPRKIYELVRSQSVRVELDYSLTLFHIEVSDMIAAVNGDKRIANLGLCKTKMDDDGDEVEIACLYTGDLITCATLVLENTVSGQRNPAYNVCRKFYIPYNAHFDPNAMLRFDGDLDFRDPQGLAKYPVDSSQLANAQVTVKTYKPVAHFTRHLTIPEIRLGDWEAQVLPASTQAN